MKIIWICNLPSPEAAKVIGHKLTGSATWTVNASKQISNFVDLHFLYPYVGNGIKYNKGEKISYYAVPVSKKLEQYDPKLEQKFYEIFEKIQPDVIHIWGTEYPHTFSALKAAERTQYIKNAIISIQGLVTAYSMVYSDGIPPKLRHKHTLRTLIFGYNVQQRAKAFERRGKYEIEALKTTKNVIGRTDWDLACTKTINPSVQYFHNNEILRETFYKHIWNYENCNKHSVFLSQGLIEYKGLYAALDALFIIKRQYPDVLLSTTGKNILSNNLRIRLALTAYEKALRNKTHKLNLDENIRFVGQLNEQEMCNAYLSSNVAITPSVIENSPNSMGEAMLLGVPVVASSVGGISSLIKHNDEGYLYPFNEPYMLAFYVMKIFEMQEKATEISYAGRKRALATHDVDTNIKELLEIYNTIKTCAIIEK